MHLALWLMLAFFDTPAGSNFEARAEFGSTGVYRDVIVIGQRAYAANERGIQILDISNPGSPQWIGEYVTCGEAQQLAATSSHLFVADGDSLQILSINNPDQPQPWASVDVPTQHVELSGSTAVALQNGNAAIYNVGNPAAPILAATLEGNITDLSVDGDLAYLLNNGALEVYDISQPANPMLAGGDPTLMGNRVLGGDGLAFVFLRINQTEDLLLLFDVGLGVIQGSLVLPQLEDFLYWDNAVHVCLGEQGLATIDVTNVHSPTLSPIVGTADHAQNISLFGTNLYVADRAGGMRIHSRANLAEVGAYTAGQTAGFFLTEGDRGLIHEADISGARLTVMDLTDRDTPVRQGSVDLDNVYHAIISPDGEMAVTTDLISGVTLLDIQNANNPFVLSTIAAPSCYAMAVVGNYLYLGSNNDLWTVNISNPASPVLVRTDGTGTCRAMVARGRYLFMVFFDGRLVVMDLVNPTSPAHVGQISFGVPVTGLSLVDDYAVVKADQDYVIDITAPPVLGPAVPLGFQLDSVIQSGEMVYYTQNGRVYEAPNLQAAPLINYDAPGAITQVTVGENHLHFGAAGRFYVVFDPAAFYALLPRWGESIDVLHLVQALP